MKRGGLGGGERGPDGVTEVSPEERRQERRDMR